MLDMGATKQQEPLGSEGHLRWKIGFFFLNFTASVIYPLRDTFVAFVAFSSNVCILEQNSFVKKEMPIGE